MFIQIKSFSDGVRCFKYTWDQKKYHVCSTVNGSCTATDAATLKEGDCYNLTAYLYSWNPASSKCTQCETVVVTPNITNNNTSTGNDTTSTVSGYILGFNDFDYQIYIGKILIKKIIKLYLSNYSPYSFSFFFQQIFE